MIITIINHNSQPDTQRNYRPGNNIRGLRIRSILVESTEDLRILIQDKRALIDLQCALRSVPLPNDNGTPKI